MTNAEEEARWQEAVAAGWSSSDAALYAEGHYTKADLEEGN